jgi:hypothetical protein
MIITAATTREDATPADIAASEATVTIPAKAVIQRGGEAHGDLRSTATSKAIRSRVGQFALGR